jgi:hypothetical protein
MVLGRLFISVEPLGRWTDQLVGLLWVPYSQVPDTTVLGFLTLHAPRGDESTASRVAWSGHATSRAQSRPGVVVLLAWVGVLFRTSCLL